MQHKLNLLLQKLFKIPKCRTLIHQNARKCSKIHENTSKYNKIQRNGPGDEVVLAGHEDVLLAEHVLLLLGLHNVLQHKNNNNKKNNKNK